MIIDYAIAVMFLLSTIVLGSKLMFIGFLIAVGWIIFVSTRGIK